jgi:hypothetical protein
VVASFRWRPRISSIEITSTFLVSELRRIRNP